MDESEERLFSDADETLAALTQAAEPAELAWSVETEPAPAASSVHHHWRTAAAFAVLLAVCGVLGAAGVVEVGEHGPLAPVAAPVYFPPFPPSSDTPEPPPPAAATVTTTVTAPAPPAMVEQWASADQRFLASLKRDGVRDPKSVPDIIAAAADACRMMREGDSYAYVERWITPPNGSYTPAEASAFVADAVSAYCPHAPMGAQA